MQKSDEIRCWLLNKKTTFGEHHIHLGCMICERVKWDTFIHPKDPKFCSCEREADEWRVPWKDTGYASTHWPVCKECIEKFFDIIEIRPETSHIYFYAFCTTHHTILAEKPKPCRNAKKAYK